MSKTRIGFWLSLLFLGFLYGRAGAQSPVSASLTPSQSELRVGDVVTLTFRVTHPQGYRLVPLELDSRWGDYEVRAISPVETTTTPDGMQTSIQRIQVTLWQPGSHTSPVLSFTLSDSEGNLQSSQAAPVTLEVVSVMVEGDDALRDLKPQAVLSPPPLWPWLLAGSALLGVLAGGLWWGYRRRRAAAAVSAPTPDLRPAYQIALDELQRIERMGLPQQGRFKEHYTLVMDTLRRYLEAAHHIPAMERTSAELRRAVRRLSLPARQKAEFAEMLQQADLVKFASVVPDGGEAHQLLGRARRWVLAAHGVQEGGR